MNKLSADYDRGVLMLTIPIAETSKPRRIQLGSQQQELPDSDSATADKATADKATADKASASSQ